MFMTAVHCCGYCKKWVVTSKGVALHIQNKPVCHRKWELFIARSRVKNNETSRSFIPLLPNDSPNDDTGMAFDEPIPPDDEMEGDNQDNRCQWSEADCVRFVHSYPRAQSEVFSKGQTTFQTWKMSNKAFSVDRWAPFQSREEWELAAWLSENIGQNKIDEFLKLPIVCQSACQVQHHRLLTITRSSNVN